MSKLVFEFDTKLTDFAQNSCAVLAKRFYCHFFGQCCCQEVTSQAVKPFVVAFSVSLSDPSLFHQTNLYVAAKFCLAAADLIQF